MELPPFSFEEFKLPKSFTPEEQEQKDREFATELLIKLGKIDSFQLSGNFIEDVNNFLELTGRDNLYKKINNGENKESVLAGLMVLRDTFEKCLKTPEEVDMNNEAKKLFYIDVPKAEIQAINKLISFYFKDFLKID